jgi:hypothetical protein
MNNRRLLKGPWPRRFTQKGPLKGPWPRRLTQKGPLRSHFGRPFLRNGERRNDEAGRARTHPLRRTRAQASAQGNGGPQHLVGLLVDARPHRPGQGTIGMVNSTLRRWVGVRAPTGECQPAGGRCSPLKAPGPWRAPSFPVPCRFSRGSRVSGNQILARQAWENLARQSPGRRCAPGSLSAGPGMHGGHRGPGA